jgi:ribonuclease I
LNGAEIFPRRFFIVVFGLWPKRNRAIGSTLQMRALFLQFCSRGWTAFVHAGMRGFDMN